MKKSINISKLVGMKLLKAFCLSLILSSLSFSAAMAQTQLSSYRPGLTPEGAVYFLPKTALRISVLVEKTTYQPGDFAPYALRYLRVADVSQDPATSFRVVGITQTPCPVPDTTKVYAVKFNPTTVASRMVLSDDGRLLGLNVDDARDVVLPAPFAPQPQPAIVNPRQYMSEEILSCGSTAKMAELTAHEIYEVRENRSLLVKGQADFMPQDGRQMQIMLDELDKQDRSLSSLFLGVTQRDTTEHRLPRAGKCCSACRRCTVSWSLMTFRAHLIIFPLTTSASCPPPTRMPRRGKQSSMRQASMSTCQGACVPPFTKELTL